MIKCKSCNEKSRVYPSFIVKGTTLTFSALIFIAFVYETSDLSLREIPQNFCDENNRIAHSTIYKAMHGLGKSIIGNDKIRENIREFKRRYLPLTEEHKVFSMPEKLLYEHTLWCESMLRELLLPLADLKIEPYLCKIFYRNIRVLRTNITRIGPSYQFNIFSGLFDETKENYSPMVPQ